jgi:hypothetical protein
LKEWWNGLLEKSAILQAEEAAEMAKSTAEEISNTVETIGGTIAENAKTAATTANTAATAANTGATAANTGATAAGTIANKRLATSFKMVSLAIKSIPGIGWLIAAITALFVIYTKITSKAREAKKAQEEFYKAVAENASKPIATINQLSATWSKLGNNIKAKEQFIDSNKSKFDSLGVSIKSVSDAEKLLIENKEKFIASQILKAKALATTELASEKYKTALEKIQDAEEPQKYVGTGSLRNQKFDAGSLIQQFGRSKSEDDLLSQGLIKLNPEWEKYQQAMEDNFAEANKLFEQAAKFTEKEQAILAKIGQSTNSIVEGSIDELQKNISKLKEQYYNAATDLERSNLFAQIQEKEKLLNKMDLLSTSKDKSKTNKEKDKDPVIQELEQKKEAYQEYFKWINSADEDVRNSATTTFSELLKGGKNYLDYLKKMREDASRTKEQLHHIDNEIAQETSTTILGEFEKGLNEQLNNARSIMEMLNIIEQRRKELESDDSGLNEQKGKILDKQGEDIAKKAKEETTQLLRSYSAYLDEKINFEIQYGERKKALDIRLEKETNDERRKIILAELAGLEKDRGKYEKLTGNQDYDNLVQEYRSFEQRKSDITEEYTKKRKVLEDELSSSNIIEQQRMRALQSLQELEKEYKKSLSELSVEILQQSDVWQKLFTDLDDLTVSEMLKLKKTIEAEFKNLNLSPESMKAIRDQLDKVTEHIQKKNPFAALLDAAKKYKAGQSNVDFKELFKSISASIELVSGSLDAVIGGLGEMGIAGDEETQKLLGDIAEMAAAAGNLAAGIATGNPLQIIQGSISLITSAFKVFNSKDREANRSIRKHAEAVKQLESAYKSLEHAVNSALGESVYENQKKLIENLRQKQAELEQMARAEHDKKESDGGKISEYTEQYYEIGRQIEGIIAGITDSVTQTTAKDAANQLADAFVEAYGKGEDAAKSFEEVSRKVMQNAVKNALKLQFLEKPLQNAIKQLQKDMGFDSEGGGTFNGLTQAEQDRFKNEVDRIGMQFSQSMEMYKDLFANLEDIDANQPTSLSGAIKGASQESIDLLAGQTNAVRANQVESIEILRDSLIQLTMINANTNKASKHLESLDGKIGNSKGEPLRGQGEIGG